jgi:predicted dehydrogenase
MAARLRVATVGAGYFSQFHYRAWARMADVELVAVCDSDEARAQDTAARYGAPQAFGNLAEMLDAVGPDVLDVIVPPAGHLTAIEAAASRGIDVICQKPFCGSLAGAQRAVELADAAGIQLIVHENFRFQPWFTKFRELLGAGSLGQVFGATFRLRPGDGQGEDAYRARQPYFRDMPRFMVHETGIHYVDVFRFLFGEVEAVTAHLRRLNTGIAGEDAGIVVMEMMGGVTAVLDANRLSDHQASDRRRTLGEMLIEAERGVLRLNGDAEIAFRAQGSNDWESVDYPWMDNDFGGDCVYLTQRAAVQALTGKAPPVNRAADYLTNLQIEEAIYASASQGRRITLR